MYILLIGRPPFMAKSEPELFAAIRRAQVSFSQAVRETISGGALNLITHLLWFDERLRLSAKEALQHRWIECTAPVPYHVNAVPSLVSNIRCFARQNKLKKAALHILAAHLEAESLAISTLRQIFVELDINNDGLLSPKELRIGLERAGVDGLPADELQELARQMDTDENGAVDYTEFLAATIDRQFHTEEKLCRAVFDVFDHDGDGYITNGDVGMMLSGSCPAEMRGSAVDLVAQIDENADGRIDFDEFMHMMQCGERLEGVKFVAKYL